MLLCWICTSTHYILLFENINSQWAIVFAAKDWDEIIPEAERKKIEEEELKQQMEELNLPPRSRKQINEVYILINSESNKIILCPCHFKLILNHSYSERHFFFE